MVEEEEIDYCPNCGEKENLRCNYDYYKIDRPLENYLCNECGTYFLPIENKIWYKNSYINIDVDKAPTTEAQLISFLKSNNAPICFVKTGKSWKKVTKEGKLEFVSRTLYLLSFREWLNIALKNK
jgi:predicted RNA-binding Zn-ribbon protein involved in translation (DUF1610 family)